MMSGRQHQVSAPKVCQWHVKPRDAAVLVIASLQNQTTSETLIFYWISLNLVVRMDKHERIRYSYVQLPEGHNLDPPPAALGQAMATPPRTVMQALRISRLAGPVARRSLC